MPSTAAQLDHCSEMYDRYRLCYVVLWYWVLAAVLVRLLGGVDAIVARRAENQTWLLDAFLCVLTWSGHGLT